MQLRAARPEDLDRLVELAAAFFVEDGFTTPEPALRRNLEHLLVDATAHVAVAGDDAREVVAFAITTTGFGLEQGAAAELEDLYVDPPVRRQGVGRQLIDDSVAWAAARGCTRLDLVVAPNGQDVSHLYDYYLARGFRDEGRRILTIGLDR